MSVVLRTKIKFWFEYLRLAHKSIDPRVISALRSNKEKYKSWGDYQNIPFDIWWKDHSTLFRETTTRKVRKYIEGEVVESDGFCLLVPLSYAPSTASKIFKEMYSRELEKIGVNFKNRKGSHGRHFSLSIHDLKVDRFRHYLFYTKNVYLPLLCAGNKVQTIKFIHKAVSAFAKVKKLKSSGKESKVPFQTTVKNDYNNLSRMTRRYNSYSKNILLNVANGEFPGKY